MVRLRIYLCSLLLVIPFYKGYALTLTIGTLSYNPPFEIQVNNSSKKNEFYGFEIELMDEICKRINAKCQYKPLLFEQILSEVNSGAIDLGIGSINITPERSERFLFSLPYKASYHQFLVPSNSNIKKIDDLKGKTIGIHLGSPTADYLTVYFNNNIQFKYYQTFMDLLNGLNDPQVSAIVTNSDQAQYWVSNTPDCKLLGDSFPFGIGFAVVARLDQAALIEKINQALIAIENDGTYIKIYNLYFQP
ncbi:TPA: transporter substrate-binding domain-containing protein [Legionella pneumophila]|nr:transporter substrate-binding domain-containing protein [Legionella pneumophila]HAU1320098.1 transporter substrate-binding domain-containing protein [Legionella pneumophila]HBC0468639.1 transporter substrate-binding domain-containing protein [Legionella pneumophila]HBD9376091.1 transporter substrate-binding domain-containing protein [Legionella pneumophila]HBI2945724.1 transporter substrate-binding domain-containing protein [Legionella pneumophila]